MSRLFLITKTIFKNTSTLNVDFSNKKGKREARSRKLTYIFLGFIFFLLSISLFFVAQQVFEKCYAANAVSDMLNFVFPVILIFLALLCMPLGISIFFLSTDNNVYLPLPIKPIEIYLGRLFVALAYSYLVTLFIGLPLIVAYNVVINPPLVIYINQLIILIALPLIPNALSFLLSLAIAKLFNIHKHKEIYTLIMSFILLSFIIGIQLAISSSTYGKDGNVDSDYLVALVKSVSSGFKFLDFFIRFPRSAFIDANWSGFGSALLTLVISMGLLFLTIFSAKAFYFKTLIGAEDGKAKQRKGSLKAAIASSKSPKNHFQAYFAKEIKCLMRTPVFVFNLIIPPIIVFVIIIVSGVGALVSLGETIDIAALQDAFKTIINYQNGGFLIPAMMTFGIFTSSISMISGTAISREGQNAYLMKTFPIRSIDIINAKVFFGILINSIYVLVILLSIGILLQIPFIIIFFMIITAILTVTLCNYISILVDLKYPSLNWTNEVFAVKQGKSVFINVFSQLGTSVIMGVLSYFLYSKGLNLILVAIATTVILSTALVLIILRLKQKDNHLFNQI